MIGTTINALTAAAAIAAFAVPAAAQDDYPSKPITIVVGYAAGGGTDAVVRALAGPLGEALGTNILVQNVNGAGGGVAATRVAREPADGYTLLATTSSTFSLEPIVQQTVYEDDDFVHIATITQFQGAVFAPADAPFDTLEEMVAHLKAEGRPLKHANYFQLDKLLLNYIAQKEGIDVVFVPVKGGNGAVQAVLSGSVDTAYSGGSWSPLVPAGQAKPIFATSHDRLKLAPDLVSMTDLGYAIGTTSFITVSAPAGTPEAIVDKLANAMETAMDDEGLQAIGQKRFMDITFRGPAETKALLDFEIGAFSEMFNVGN